MFIFVCLVDKLGQDSLGRIIITRFNPDYFTYIVGIRRSNLSVIYVVTIRVNPDISSINNSVRYFVKYSIIIRI